MSRARFSISMLAFVPVVFACSGMTPSTREPTTPWNQQAVTSLAAQLENNTEPAHS
jgi:hypothetical protein